MNRRWVPYVGVAILGLLIILALVLSGGGGLLPGAAMPIDGDPTSEPDPTDEGEDMCETTQGVIPCDEVCEDENGDLVRCPDEHENDNDSGQATSAAPEARACSLFVPDVGDAEELGLIATDAEPGTDILIASDGDGDPIVARIRDPFQGTDVFQVPEEYRSADYWFAVEGCGRWHGGAELGFGD